MKRIFGIFVTLMLCMAMMMPAFATTVGGGVVNAKPTANTGTVEKGFDYSAPDDPADIFGIPSVSFEDVTERLNNRATAFTFRKLPYAVRWDLKRPYSAFS